MVAYAITMSDLAKVLVVMAQRIGAMVKNVENFVKRHVTNAQVGARLKFVNNFSSSSITYGSQNLSLLIIDDLSLNYNLTDVQKNSMNHSVGP